MIVRNMSRWNDLILLWIEAQWREEESDHFPLQKSFEIPNQLVGLFVHFSIHSNIPEKIYKNKPSGSIYKIRRKACLDIQLRNYRCKISFLVWT